MLNFIGTAARHMVDLAARRYAAPDIETLRQICIALEEKGFGSSVCFWNEDSDSIEYVIGSSLRLLEVLRLLNPDCYLSVKLPALRFDLRALNVIIEASNRAQRLVHFDSHRNEDANGMFLAIEGTLQHSRNLGCTIPGRWRRSIEDARLACDWRLRVRVVKGQWADPQDPDMDMRAGFLRVIDELCGRATKVAVATHDLPLARLAIRRLLDAGTPCELELLYGLPRRAAIRTGQSLDVPIRFYVPEGKAWLPYVIRSARKNPRVFGWIARDIVRGILPQTMRFY